MKHRLEAYNMPNKHQIMANLFRRTCHLFPSDLDSDHLVHPLHPRLPRPRLGLVLPVGGLGHLLGHVLLLHHPFYGEYELDALLLVMFSFQVGFGDMVPTKSFLGYEVQTRPQINSIIVVLLNVFRRACMESSKWWYA